MIKLYFFTTLYSVISVFVVLLGSILFVNTQNMMALPIIGFVFAIIFSNIAIKLNANNYKGFEHPAFLFIVVFFISVMNLGYLNLAYFYYPYLIFRLLKIKYGFAVEKNKA